MECKTCNDYRYTCNGKNPCPDHEASQHQWVLCECQKKTGQGIFNCGCGEIEQIQISIGGVKVFAYCNDCEKISFETPEHKFGREMIMNDVSNEIKILNIKLNDLESGKYFVNDLLK
jgi:hypothetical protein